MCLSVRFRLEAAALRPSSEVRGQTGSTGAAGEEVQGDSHRQHDNLIKHGCGEVLVVVMSFLLTRRRSTTCVTTHSRPETSTAW